MSKIIFLALLFLQVTACAQTKTAITANDVARIENVLAADSLQGRRAGTPGSDKAAAFIAAEFQKAGLQPLAGNSYLQAFQMVQAKLVQQNGAVEGQPVKPENMVVVSYQQRLQVTESSGYTIEHVRKGENIFSRIGGIMKQQGNKVVFVDAAFADQFQRLNGFKRPVFEAEQARLTESNTVFVLGDAEPKTFSFDATQDIETLKLTNVVGVLPGKTKPGEQVIFSGHYDHLGIGQPQNGDSIYNGANDDAAGTTAVILLADYFKRLNNNARTLIFVAFTAEEIGGFGSQYFSRQLQPDSLVAMFNIEMIGTESKWGRNSAYITGYDKTNMGTILQKNLAGSQFTFHPDPYPDQQLFYRSDNATLARLGVPAHTISTSKMDNEPNYHQASDEVKTLDLTNMAQIINAIAQSSKTIVSGKDTPTRVKASSLR